MITSVRLSLGTLKESQQHNDEDVSLLASRLNTKLGSSHPKIGSRLSIDKAYFSIDHACFVVMECHSAVVKRAYISMMSELAAASGLNISSLYSFPFIYLFGCVSTQSTQKSSLFCLLNGKSF